jgi:predicted O-methyltransferase YrrM
MLQRAIDLFHVFNASRELSWAAKKIKKASGTENTNSLINIIFEPPFQRFFWIKQVRSEITQLSNLVNRMKPKRILEIGTAQGGSLFLITRNSAADAHLISLDLPEGKFGGGYPAYRSRFYKSFTSQQQKMDLIRGDSHKKEMLDQVRSLLNGQLLDFLFIDGDHTYEGVKQDFEWYSSLVDQSGVIAFHDIAHHGEESDCKVFDFWNELKKSYTHVEFVEDPRQGWAGIGVIFLNPQTAEKHKV